MDTIVSRADPRPQRPWRGFVAAVAIGIAALIAFTAVDGLLRNPTTVDRITVRNERADLVEVLVERDGSLLTVAVVDPQRSADAHDVVDQGARWTFVVRVSDETVTKIRLTRDQLEQSGWTVVVPPEGG